jgi:hypothetical protein
MLILKIIFLKKILSQERKNYKKTTAASQKG